MVRDTYEYEFKPTRSLLIAVFAKTVEDVQARQGHLQRDAREFCLSPGFAWLWEALRDDLAGMPSTPEVRELVLAGKVVLPSNYQQFQSKKGGTKPCYA